MRLSTAKGSAVWWLQFWWVALLVDVPWFLLGASDDRGSFGEACRVFLTSFDRVREHLHDILLTIMKSIKAPNTPKTSAISQWQRPNKEETTSHHTKTGPFRPGGLALRRF